MPKARVLAVDDQRYFRELIEGLLCDEGYEVQTASSGEEALHILEREDFEIVLTDLVMPGIDGTELVSRIKERLPDQEIVMVTGVVDVKTAVEAMKQGATDYILKPFDRKILVRSLDKILQRRRLRDEHERLMAENLEFMSVLSLYERATGLFSTLSLEPLAERLVEGLCLETRAQGGVLWIAREAGSSELGLAAARGLIRVEEEPESLDAARLGGEFAGVQSGEGSFVANVQRGGSRTQALCVPLRQGGELIGLARLSDKLDGAAFAPRDRAAAEKFVSFGSQALLNALRFRGLERRSFRDPTTKAYTRAYFEDVVRNEIQKASRFGHRFSMIHLALDGLSEFRRTLNEAELASWLERLVHAMGGALRSTDLLATLDLHRYAILLPETDGLGAAVLKQRVRESVDASALLAHSDGRASPKLVLSSATYPTDGTQLEALDATLVERLEEARHTRYPAPGKKADALGDAFDMVVRQGERLSRESAPQIARFVLEEVGRRPRDRGLVFLSPGEHLMPAVHAGLELLDGQDVRSELVVVGEKGDGADWDLPITWVTPGMLATDRSFVLCYGDGPAYALVNDPSTGLRGGGVCHTADRGLVEHLVFQLQRDLGIPLGV